MMPPDVRLVSWWRSPTRAVETWLAADLRCQQRGGEGRWGLSWTPCACACPGVDLPSRSLLGARSARQAAREWDPRWHNRLDIQELEAPVAHHPGPHARPLSLLNCWPHQFQTAIMARRRVLTRTGTLSSGIGFFRNAFSCVSASIVSKAPDSPDEIALSFAGFAEALLLLGWSASSRQSGRVAGAG